MNDYKFHGNPKDDEGVKNEQVVEICEFVIQKNWERVHENHSKEIPFEEMLKILNSTATAWSLATDVIEYAKELEEEKDMKKHLGNSDEDDDDNGSLDLEG